MARPRAMQTVRSASLVAGETARKPVHLRKDQVVQAPVKAAFNNRCSPFSPAMRL